VIEIHDEFIFESPEATAAEACERMCQVMVVGMEQYMPNVPVKVEPSMFRVWSKSADERRDVSGRLQVWEAT
jgi:DNA polymerase I-like protein with 3'-5' exonuclease and polymerase domains